MLFSATKKVTGADGKARLSAGLGQLLLLGLARLVEQRTSRKVRQPSVCGVVMYKAIICFDSSPRHLSVPAYSFWL